MSRTNIPMIINLRQNKNDDSTAYGKYFAEVDSKEPLNLKGFAKHMTAHGKIADYQMCVLVLGQVVDCMSELLSQGQPVKLDGLGTFYPTIEAVNGGIESIEAAKEVSAASVVEGVHVRFTPENAELDRITSKAFKERCSLVWGDEIEITGYKDAQKKYGPIYRKTPISNPTVEPEPEP